MNFSFTDCRRLKVALPFVCNVCIVHSRLFFPLTLLIFFNITMLDSFDVAVVVVVVMKILFSV